MQASEVFMQHYWSLAKLGKAQCIGQNESLAYELASYETLSNLKTDEGRTLCLPKIVEIHMLLFLKLGKVSLKLLSSLWSYKN